MSGRGGGRGGRGGGRFGGRGGAPMGPVARDEDGTILATAPAGPPPLFPETELPEHPEITAKDKMLLLRRFELSHRSKFSPYFLELPKSQKGPPGFKHSRGKTPISERRPEEETTPRLAKMEGAREGEEGGGAGGRKGPGGEGGDEEEGAEEEQLHDTDEEEDMEDDDYYQSHHRHHQTAWRRHIFHAHSACPPSDSCTKPHAPAFLPHISVALSPALRLPLPRLASHCRASISTMTRAMEMPLMRAATRGRSTNTQARTQARTRRPAPCGLKELECMVGRAATNTVGGAVGWWSC
eukprot:XP_001696093.1 predicted protein [Chlamydomonas reinhardtii]